MVRAARSFRPLQAHLMWKKVFASLQWQGLYPDCRSHFHTTALQGCNWVLCVGTAGVVQLLDFKRWFPSAASHMWLNWESLCLNAKREFPCLYWAAADISWSIYCFPACGPYVIRRLTENCCKEKEKMIVLGMQRSDKTKWPKGPEHRKLNWKLIYLKKKQLHWEPRPSVSFMLSEYFLLWFICASN